MKLSSRFLSDVLFAYLWGFILILLSILIFYFVHGKFLWTNFLQFDAEHYYKIAFVGYNHKRSAFFPLFPWIWKIIGNSISLSILFNISLFSLSFGILASIFHWNFFQKLLFLSIPSSIFYFLPYSESLFAFGCSLLLYCFIQKKFEWVIGCFIFICFTRPAFTILLPALMIYLLFEKLNIKKKFFLFLSCALISIFTMILINEYQFSFTQIQWSFFSAQSTYWDNHWRLPKFPLSTYGDNFILRIDLFTFWLGCFSLYLLVVNFLKKLKNHNLDFEPYWIFILSYVWGITMLVLLTRGGSLFSLNRFVFSTVLGGILLIQLPIFLKKYRLAGIILYIIILFMEKFYLHIQHFLALVSIFLPIVFLMFWENKIAKWSLIFIFTVSQCILMQKFMLRIWVA
jgi:hypothetical protein